LAFKNIPVKNSEVVPLMKNTFLDTPKYQYFYHAYADIYQWERAKDTLDFLLADFGKSLSVDQSKLYQSMFIRQINKIRFQVDSVKIPQPKSR
jgi:hypothetical protein